MDKFTDRQQAGLILAELLKNHLNKTDVIALALPRGGVPVAYEIATALSIPLDVFIVRKLGIPGHEECAMGAIASGETMVINESMVRALDLQKNSIDSVVKAELEEMKRREDVYRGKRRFPDLANKQIILIDDGIATGATIKAAIRAIRTHKPAEIIVAVPVGSQDACQSIIPLVDKLICPLQPIHFYAVGLWYETFSQTTDDEVISLLNNAVQLSDKQ